MSTNLYKEYLSRKAQRVASLGKTIQPEDLHPMLFDYQRKIVVDAVKRGRSALFADTGCGKTIMQVSWARIMSEGGAALILAPLAVAAQTVREARKIDVDITHCRESSDVRPGINITNYERLEKFDISQFTALVLDESSILKSQDGKTRTSLIEQAQAIPYRLACTATPAPNDVMELGNHAEFLGLMTNAEMFATYFVHDGGETQKWRLKGHADRPFWQWVASWATIMHKPGDLGFSNDGFILPELIMHEHIVDSDNTASDTLFRMPVTTLTERRSARQSSMDDRVAKAAEIVNTAQDESSWIVWCEYNAEQDELARIFGDQCISIFGAQSPDEKEQKLLQWLNQDRSILLTKPSIAGFGINAQICHNVIFVGVSDSFEKFYQAIRRCWRFGQKHDVHCHVILSEAEITVLENLKRKERDAALMRSKMIASASQVHTIARPTRAYTHRSSEAPSWLLTAL